MNRYIAKKYFIMGLLSLGIGRGVAHGQDAPRRERRHQKTEVRANDTIAKQTLTHETPIIGIKTTTPPKQKSIKFGHVDDSYRVDANACADANAGAVRAIFAPVVIANPFVKFANKYTVGAHADIMIHNYTTKSLEPVVREMYMYGVANIGRHKIDLRAGRIPLTDNIDDASKYMPVTDLLFNTVYSPGTYISHAVATTYRAQDFEIGLGYFYDTTVFDSGHGIILSWTQEIGDNTSFGGTLLHNMSQSRGEIYFTAKPTYRDYILIRALNIGERPILYGTWGHTVRNDAVAFSTCGFLETHDGACGGNIGIYHIKSGAYATIGAARHNPANAPGTPEYEKWTPSVQVGLKRTIAPNKQR